MHTPFAGRSGTSSGRYRRPFGFAVAAMALCLQQSAAQETPDFHFDVLPILTRLGCNSGACHGAAAGRGEFRLSLFGSRPADDFDSITRHLNSRRINYAYPEKSLFLRKPSGELSHEGGLLLEQNSSDYRTLIQWIRSGALPPGRSKAFRILPSPRVLTLNPGDHGSLKVSIELDDHTTRDISSQVSVIAPDQQSLVVQSDVEGRALVVTPLRPGRHVFLVRFPGFVEAIEVLSAEPRHHPAPASGIPTAPGIASADLRDVDSLIQHRLEQLGLAVAPPADDRTRLVRTSLLLTGQAPGYEEVLAFERNSTSGKNNELIEQRLQSDEFLDFWSLQVAGILGIRRLQDSHMAQSWQTWLRSQLKSGRGMHDLVSDMLLSEGSMNQNAAVAFHLIAPDGRAFAEYFSETLLGNRMRCANCHDHPLDHWTQDDFHGLAAIFAGIERGPVVRRSPGRTYIHPGTGRSATCRLPDGTSLADPSLRIAALAEWVRGDGRDAVSRNIVNRVWKSLIGTALIEPVDDLRSTNPASHPDVLHLLTRQFSETRGDLRSLIRQICLTQAFARQTTEHDSNSETQFFAVRSAQPLTPSVLINRVRRATDPRTRTSLLHPTSEVDAAIRSLETTRGCGDNCLNSGSSETLLSSIDQIAGKTINDLLTIHSPVIQSAAAHSDTKLAVRELYTAILLRQPDDAELELWCRELSSVASESRSIILVDIAWVLLTSREFQNVL